MFELPHSLWSVMAWVIGALQEQQILSRQLLLLCVFLDSVSLLGFQCASSRTNGGHPFLAISRSIEITTWQAMANARMTLPAKDRFCTISLELRIRPQHFDAVGLDVYFQSISRI
ncbi:hypothetical protein K402DRAFT_139881 [Aulographum hederae CBS 113979]|uniref:Uncharacterized protein n=1 Tax=Aulographum hederae CBS 113979 TaxID=1176131 RepID=A0A6G1GUX5_9PEZI|nr:hypothetical protein K402DRAFT_139881 [Aulographum hederae CBS 113979]